jgi:hypothetical protein
MKNNPGVKSGVVAEMFGINPKTVYGIKWKLSKMATSSTPIDKATGVTPQMIGSVIAELSRGRGRPKARLATSADFVKPDLVNHPPHYTDGGIETIDFIEAKRLGYHLGNVVKYICRAGKKGTNMGMQDLQKARWYLDRAIEKNEINPPSR